MKSFFKIVSSLNIYGVEEFLYSREKKGFSRVQVYKIFYSFCLKVFTYSQCPDSVERMVPKFDKDLSSCTEKLFSHPRRKYQMNKAQVSQNRKKLKISTEKSSHSYSAP